jgi:hypothetical protein
MSTSSLEAANEVLGRHLQYGVWENSKTSLEVLESLQYSTTKSLGLIRPGATRLRTWRTYSRKRDGIWPYTNCNYSYRSGTTCTAVELVRTEGNYFKSTQVGLLSSYPARISM